MRLQHKPWDEQEDGLLRRMWLEGWSAGRIAAVMRGRSRCSVISRVRRLGLRRPTIASRSIRRAPAVREADERRSLARLNQKREQWESLRTARDACVFCAVREDQHEAFGCKNFQARRVA